MFNSGGFVTNVKGIAVASTPTYLNRHGVDYSDRDFINSVLLLDGPAIGEPVLGKVNNFALIAMAVPIHNAQGKIIGIVAGTTNLESSSFLDRVSAHKYGNTGGYVLIDRSSRRVITATDGRRVMELLPSPGTNQLLDDHMAGSEGTELAINPKGVQTISSTKQINIAKWVYRG